MHLHPYQTLSLKVFILDNLVDLITKTWSFELPVLRALGIDSIKLDWVNSTAPDFLDKSLLRSFFPEAGGPIKTTDEADLFMFRKNIV